MARESFLMYLSFEELLMRLTPDELRLMMLAIFRYHRGGELPNFGDNRVLDMCWQSLKSDFDRDAEKYNAVCERNRRNGMRGGRPKNQENPKNPLGFNETQENPEKPKKPDTDTDNDTDNDNDVLNNISTETQQQSLFETCLTFDEFWNMYGKKIERVKCEKIYAKIKEDDREKIKNHVPVYVASTPEVQYRKNPQTYLNGHCWEDEIITTNEREQNNGNSKRTSEYGRYVPKHL